MKALAEGLPILYNHVVKEVKYDQQGVTVTAGNTVIAGAHILLGPCNKQVHYVLLPGHHLTSFLT